MSNPKFLNVEKRVPYSVRLPQRLIDKLNAYAELTGNTTTNIINIVLEDFIAEKNVMNDYLDIGGVTVKIPYAIYQKNRSITENWNLKEYNSYENIDYYAGDSRIVEIYFAELFEVKRISNNLDIYNGDSYVANKNILKFNFNAIHSGIELFVYNITETIFADVDNFYSGDVDSFVNCLYCLYFEVAANNSVTIHLIDYITAIDLLSASGNDEYKDLIIAAATELSDIDNVVSSFKDDFYDGEIKIAEKYFSGDDLSDENNKKYTDAVEVLEKEIKNKCESKCNELVDAIADGYNSNNIIRFGSDIFSRLAVKEINAASPDNVDDLLDKIISEKIDEIFDERIGEIEKRSADINDKIDNVNKLIESEFNKNK